MLKKPLACNEASRYEQHQLYLSSQLLAINMACERIRCTLKCSKLFSCIIKFESIGNHS